MTDTRIIFGIGTRVGLFSHLEKMSRLHYSRCEQSKDDDVIVLTHCDDSKLMDR